MAEKKEYPRKMPLAPVDDATSAPSKPRVGPKPAPKTSKTTTKPDRLLTSDELERRYDMERRKNLNAASKTGKPTGYKKGGSIDGCAIRGKTKGRFV